MIVIILGSITMIYKHQKTQKEQEQKEQERLLAMREIYNANKGEELEQTEPIQKDTTVTISVIGDILCEQPLYEDAKKEDGFDFSPMFEHIAKYTKKSDITIGTLETNFVQQNLSGFMKYNSPKELAIALKDIGVNVVSTATNHSLDYGKKGIVDTKEYLETLKIDTVGTRKETQDSRILIKEIRGIKIAFLSYTYGINNDSNMRTEEKECVNQIEKEEILQDIVQAKQEGAQYICAMMHWGDIAKEEINKQQVEITSFLLENEVDLVLGSHPSVIQKMEIRQNAKQKDSFVAYSMGNFVSASSYQNSDIEMILEIQISKSAETGEVTLRKVNYTPVYLLDNGTKAENRYQLYDIKDVIKRYQIGDTEIVTQEIYEKLVEALEKIEVLIGKKQ